MKNKIMVSISIVFLVLSLTHITLNFIPNVSAEPAAKEVWKVLRIDNDKPDPIVIDVNVTVNSHSGVYIAASNDTTTYFRDRAYWLSQYDNYTDWLNGWSAPTHWGEMNWRVSGGSTGPISYDAIQQWGSLYSDSGGGVGYTTFMGSTYMADWNMTYDPIHPPIHDDPDILRYSQTSIESPWFGPGTNTVKMIDDVYVPVGNSTWIVFKIVLTVPGTFTFNLTVNAGVPYIMIDELTWIHESTWTIGGANTFLVPYDHPTIQSAIDNSSAGSTIFVYNETIHNGIYTEDLNIPSTKTNLDIKSVSGADKTKIKGVLTVPAASWPLAIPNIAVSASGVKLHGFTIESPDWTNDFYSSGIIIGAPNVEIFDNFFRVLGGTDIGEISQGVQTWHSLAEPGVDISGLNIHNNTFTNLNDGAAGYEAIYLNPDTGTGSATIRNNTFSGQLCRAITTERSNVAISNNSIITDLVAGLPGGYQGINVGGANSGNLTNVSVVGNTIKGSGTGFGFSYGIKIGYADTSALTAINITNNTIQMNDVGIRVRYSAAGIIIRWNNFADNTNYAVNNENTTQLDAGYNWWNSTTGPNHALSQYPTSPGDKVSDNVLYEPWLIKPNPPAIPVSVVYIDPKNKTWNTPSWGQYFTVNVIITNQSKMWGFQFSLKWNNSLINLINPDTALVIPSAWGSYCVSNHTYGPGNYNAGVQANPPAPGISAPTTFGGFTFKSVFDPEYPDSAGCNITLENVIIVDTGKGEIPKLVYGGTYNVTSAKPKLSFDKNYSAQNVPTEFDAYVIAANARNLTSFRFEVNFNSTLLDAIAVSVTYPIKYVNFAVGGTVFVDVDKIDPAINGTAVLATIRFKVIGTTWNNNTQPINTTLDFTTNCHFNNATIDEVIDGFYEYTPLIGDLNMDGTVNIIDLAAAARAFGTRGPPLVDPPDAGWLQVADLKRDGTINILDLVIIAYNWSG